MASYLAKEKGKMNRPKRKRGWIRHSSLHCNVREVAACVTSTGGKKPPMLAGAKGRLLRVRQSVRGSWEEGGAERALLMAHGGSFFSEVRRSRVVHAA